MTGAGEQPAAVVPPRVLVVTSTFPRWRADSEPAFVFNLCRYLRGRGMDIDVLAPHAAGAARHEVMEGLNVFRYRYFFTRLQSLAYSGGILARLARNPLNYLLVPWFLLAQAVAVIRRIRSVEYDVIHAHWLIPQGLICALARGTLGERAPALVCTSHGGDLYALEYPLFRALKKWAAARSDCLCVVSNAMKIRALTLGVDSARIRVMPMGVDLRHTFRPVEGVARVRRRLIFVGRLVEKKGLDTLLEALSRLADEYPDIELLIAGDGPLRVPLERKALALGLSGKAVFLGSVASDRLPDLYSSADIAVVPSVIAASGDQEGLGLVIIEAMGCGCAVVASALDAIGDVVDAETGLFARPGDPADLAEKIRRLLEDPGYCRRLSERAREKVLSRFDWEITGEAYARLLGGAGEQEASPAC